MKSYLSHPGGSSQSAGNTVPAAGEGGMRSEEGGAQSLFSARLFGR